MAEITASMVMALRAKTDAPMMDCKKALTEADGNEQRAEELLRVRFGNKKHQVESQQKEQLLHQLVIMVKQVFF